MYFGGVKAVDGLSFKGARGRDLWPDRPQQRRQDHGVQLHHAVLQAHGRQLLFRGRGEKVIDLTRGGYTMSFCTALSAPFRTWRSYVSSQCLKTC